MAGFKVITEGSSAAAPEAFAILKRLGGYSEVLRGEILNWVQQSQVNPRISHDIELIATHLVRLIPEMRVALQSLLRLTEVQPDSAIAENGNSDCGLHNGSYFEVALRDEGSGWKGFADLIELSAAKVCITDFKTGVPKDEDTDQLRIYALLWARDRSKNPHGRLATELLLLYPGATVSVPVPTESELREIAQTLKDRTAKITAELALVPPPARINESCCYCDVRQLCSEYWKRGSANSNDDGMPNLVDCEISLEYKIGFGTWRARVLSASKPLRKPEVTVHFSDKGIDLNRGSQLRLLRINVEDAESDCPIVTVRSSTELFVVPVHGE